MSIDKPRSVLEKSISYDVEKVSHDHDQNLDEDQDDDGPLKARRMLVVQLIAQDLKQLMHNAEPLVQDFDSFRDIEIVRGASIERFELRVVPEKFRSIQNLRVKVDEVSFDEELAHFAGNFSAR